MNTDTVDPAPGVQLGWFDWLRRELAPFPGRGTATVRIVVTVVLVTIISMALRVPEALLSGYMVFFATKENKVVTALTGLLLFVGVTIGIAVSLLVYRYTFDFPELRIPTMALVLFLCFYFSRVFAMGPLAFAVGFVIAATQSIAELEPTAEDLVQTLLWLWLAVAYPVVLTVIVNQILLPAQLQDNKSETPESDKADRLAEFRGPLLAADSFTNPAHVHYALKVTLAAMLCYIFYTAVDWAGIHTAFITCCFISLESLGATLHKGALRLAGCLFGGLLGFISILYLIPHMESITSLALLVAAVSFLAGWVAMGSERIAYAGLQIALAFFMCVLQSFEQDVDLTKIRDRVVGIIFGIVVTTVVFRYVWPERAALRGAIGVCAGEDYSAPNA